MSPPWEGRTIVITGAGRGIGREHALFLASHGAQLVINDLGGGSDGTGSDAGPAQLLADEIVAADGAQRLIDTAVETFGDLHGLVNNSGIIRDRTLFNMTDDDWDVSIRVNLRGRFAPARAAARYWRDRSKGGSEVSKLDNDGPWDLDTLIATAGAATAPANTGRDTGIVR
jgi:NAD(P)-dependent dehydrogenase (short-subunit alcohol dehydrogenase family)